MSKNALTLLERFRLRTKSLQGRINTGRLVVGVLIEKDGRYLLIDEKRKEGIFLNIPAGHVDPKETPREAAIREAREECGLEVELTGIRMVLCNTWKQGTHSVYWVFDGRVRSGSIQTENDSQAHWLTVKEWQERMASMKSMPTIPSLLESVEKGLSIAPAALYFIDRRQEPVSRESLS